MAALRDSVDLPVGGRAAYEVGAARLPRAVGEAEAVQAPEAFRAAVTAFCDAHPVETRTGRSRGPRSRAGS